MIPQQPKKKGFHDLAIKRLRQEYGVKFRSDKPPRQTVFELFPQIKQTLEKEEIQKKLEDQLFEMKIGSPPK